MRPMPIFVAALLGTVGVTALACENPPLAQVPTERLDERERERVRESVGVYFEAMRAYTTCLQAELAAAGGDDAPAMTKLVLVNRNNGAVAEAEVVLRLFNQHVGAPAEGPPSPAAPPPESPRGRDRD